MKKKCAAKEGTGFDDSDLSPGHSMRWSLALPHTRCDQSIPSVTRVQTFAFLKDSHPSAQPGQEGVCGGLGLLTSTIDFFKCY